MQLIEAPPTQLLRAQRLYLRPATPQDLEALQSLWTDAKVRSALFQGQLISLANIQAELEASQMSFQRHGYGQWAIIPAAEDAPIGFIGLRYAQDPPQLHISGALDPPCHGLGYGVEAAQTLLQYALRTLKLPRILAQTTADNMPALKLFERVGMRFSRRQQIAGLNLITYAIEPQDLPDI